MTGYEKQAGGGTGFPLTGKVVTAHPSRVAQADQIAASEGVKTVKLSEFVPPTHVYIIDLDELTKLPESGSFLV